MGDRQVIRPCKIRNSARQTIETEVFAFFEIMKVDFQGQVEGIVAFAGYVSHEDAIAAEALQFPGVKEREKKFPAHVEMKSDLLFIAEDRAWVCDGESEEAGLIRGFGFFPFCRFVHFALHDGSKDLGFERDAEVLTGNMLCEPAT